MYIETYTISNTSMLNQITLAYLEKAGNNQGQSMRLTEKMIAYTNVYGNMTFQELRSICPDKPKTLDLQNGEDLEH